MRRPVPSSMSNPFAARPPKHARHTVQQPEPLPEQVEQPKPQEVDSSPEAPVQSGFSVFNPTPAVKDTMMSDKDAEKAKTAEERAAAKAEREAARAAKKAEAEAAKATKIAEREAKKAEAEAAKAARAAEREAKKAERAAELGEQSKMAALRDAKKNYVKSATGQLRSNDELAVALDAVQPTAVIAIALRLLKLDVNPYQRLNVGQQSMNLRNKLRGAIKRNVLTIADVIAERDAQATPAEVTE